MNTEIEPVLREFISQNLLFTEGIYPFPDAASFLAEGVVDSIGMMELVDFVSTQFNLEIPVNDITQQNFDSISSLAGYIRRRQVQAAHAQRPALTELTTPAGPLVQPRAAETARL